MLLVDDVKGGAGWGCKSIKGFEESPLWRVASDSGNGCAQRVGRLSVRFEDNGKLDSR